MRFSYLSHCYSERVPSFGGWSGLGVRQLKSTETGDSSNSFSAVIESHLGTHIDAPRHFFNDGPNVASYAAGFFVFATPQVIEVDLEPTELLMAVNIADSIQSNTDLLLLKSGWARFRSEPKYCRSNPGISPCLSRVIRQNFPSIRAVGIDWISVSSYDYRDLGREAHGVFLDPNGPNNPVLLIEDMDLSANMQGLRRVIVAPLRILDFDSAPCTVIGEWND